MSEKDTAANTAENNNTHATNQPILIFHRSKENAKESRMNQAFFIMGYNKNYPHSESIEVIDYETGDYELAREINEIMLDSTKKPVVIINSSIPAMEYDEKYDMYSRFSDLSGSGKIELYLMDSRGRLYKKVESLEKVLELN